MSEPSEQNTSAQLTRAVARVLGEGALAALATIVEASRGVGAKVLIETVGERTGTTGDAVLDDALGERASAFLASHAEAKTVRVDECAPTLDSWRGARVLFERVVTEPHVGGCGAGHVRPS